MMCCRDMSSLKIWLIQKPANYCLKQELLSLQTAWKSSKNLSLRKFQLSIQVNLTLDHISITQCCLTKIKHKKMHYLTFTKQLNWAKLLLQLRLRKLILIACFSPKTDIIYL